MKTMRATIHKLALVAVLLGAGSAVATPPQTGVQGQAFAISPGFWYFVEPGIAIGVGSIQLPVATSFTVLSSHNGREIERVNTDAAGFYSVALPPGKYVLVPDEIVLNGFPRCTASTGPIEVEVKVKQLTLQNVFYTAIPCAVIPVPM
jgi:hypothetical protein